MNATMIVVNKVEEDEEGYEEFTGQWMISLVGAGESFGRYVIKVLGVCEEYGEAIRAARMASKARSESPEVYIALSDLSFAMPEKKN